MASKAIAVGVYRVSDSRRNTVAALIAATVQAAIMLALLASFGGRESGIATPFDNPLVTITTESPKSPPRSSPTRSVTHQRKTGGGAASTEITSDPVSGPAADAIRITVPVTQLLAADSFGTVGNSGVVGDVGGMGTGAGSSGGNGSGQGNGAEGSDARWLSGAITEHDYPRVAWKSGQKGRVGLKFTVTSDGRVSRCDVTHSSGSPLLDETTCRLILKRFRYSPARDATGRAISDEVTGEHEWAVALPAENHTLQNL